MSFNIYDRVNHVLKNVAGTPGIFSRLIPGLVPKAPTGSGTTKCLTEDGTWSEPTDSTTRSMVRDSSSFSSTGDVYSTTQSYKVGDLVVYDNIIYRCNTACTAGSWATNSANFTQRSVVKELTNINSALTLEQIPLTFNTTNFTDSGSVAYKYGNLIQIFVKGTMRNGNDGAPIIYIPSDYLPPVGYRTMGFSNIGNKLEINRITATVNTISLRGNFTASELTGNMLYMLT